MSFDLKLAEIIAIDMCKHNKNKLFKTREIYKLPKVAEYIKTTTIKCPNDNIRATLQDCSYFEFVSDMPKLKGKRRNGEWRLSKEFLQIVKNIS